MFQIKFSVMSFVSTQTYIAIVLARETMQSDHLCSSAVAELERFISLKDIDHLVVTQLAPKNVASIKAFLQRRNTSDSASQLQITLSNPARQVLKSTMGTPLPGISCCS